MKNLSETPWKKSFNLELLKIKSKLKPIWTYGLEIGGSTELTNINCFQSFQSKVLRKIVNAPFYVPNWVLHKDLNVPTVADLASTCYKSFHSSFHLHTNPLVRALSLYLAPKSPPAFEEALAKEFPPQVIVKWSASTEWYQ